MRLHLSGPFKFRDNVKRRQQYVHLNLLFEMRFELATMQMNKAQT